VRTTSPGRPITRLTAIFSGSWGFLLMRGLSGHQWDRAEESFAPLPEGHHHATLKVPLRIQLVYQAQVPSQGFMVLRIQERVHGRSTDEGDLCHIGVKPNEWRKPCYVSNEMMCELTQELRHHAINPSDVSEFCVANSPSW